MDKKGIYDLLEEREEIPKPFGGMMKHQTMMNNFVSSNTLNEGIS